MSEISAEEAKHDSEASVIGICDWNTTTSWWTASRLSLAYFQASKSHPGGGRWSSGFVFRPRITTANDESMLAAGTVRGGDGHTEACVWRRARCLELSMTSVLIMQNMARRSPVVSTGLLLAIFKTFSSERFLQFRNTLRWPGPMRTFTDISTDAIQSINQSINHSIIQSFKGVSSFFETLYE